MSYEGTSISSVLFRINHDSGTYSIPVQYVQWVEPLAEKIAVVPHSPEHITGVYSVHGKNISVVDLGCLLALERTSDSKLSSRNLLIIKNTKIGLLVESVLGVKTIHSRQKAGSLTNPLIQNVCAYDDRDELAFELDIPCLLSIC